MLKTIVEKFRRTKSVQLLLDFRNEILYRQFLGSSVSRGHAFAETLKQSPERNYCFTIAFNTPWVIDALATAWRIFAPGTRLVVIDNSSKPDARIAIEAICRQRGVAYFPLPRNFERNPSRSHGISQTWAFHNIIRKLSPDMFGFIDHDCFPISHVDMEKLIGDRIGYGLALKAKSTYLYKSPKDEDRWVYWAGLCFYDFSAVEHVNLDFRHRLDIGMDTGGGNWPVLYAKFSDAQFGKATVGSMTVNVQDRDVEYQMFDNAFFHVGGASYRQFATNPEYRRSLCDHIWDTYLGGTRERLASG